MAWLKRGLAREVGCLITLGDPSGGLVGGFRAVKLDSFCSVTRRRGGGKYVWGENLVIRFGVNLAEKEPGSGCVWAVRGPIAGRVSMIGVGSKFVCGRGLRLEESGGGDDAST